MSQRCVSQNGSRSPLLVVAGSQGLLLGSCEVDKEVSGREELSPKRRT